VLDWAKRKMPKREEILESRLVRPFSHLLGDPGLWRFNRRAVARGAAVGLFVGFMIPVAQTPIAALAAVPTRGNVAIAALATFITNPFTTPAILLGAYETGSWLLQQKQAAIARVAPDEWLGRTIDWLSGLALPTIVGLLLFSVVAALAAYGLTHIGWRVWVSRRWLSRRAARQARSG
jgi:uncharacterized protein (DUF2062 family)